MIINGNMGQIIPNSGIEEKTKVVKENSFGNILKEKLDKVNDFQIKADESTQRLITGEEQDLHRVMAATEEARLALEIAVQVRNKLVESYQEISRMQV